MSDTEKDIQRTDNLGRFLNGHTVRFDVFGSSRTAERAYRRAERLCAGVFLLTAHIPNGDPLKRQSREQETGLMPGVIQARHDLRQQASQGVDELVVKVRHLISLMRMLAVAGFVSTQNAEVLVEALDEFGVFLISAQRSSMSERMIFTKEEFTDIGKVSNGKSGLSRTVPKLSLKDRGIVKDSPSMSDRSGSSSGGGVDGVRARNILSVLRSGGALGIKDIAANLPEYSEKMIQRELLGLVGAGKVKKIGLKRWSKYSVSE